MNINIVREFYTLEDESYPTNRFGKVNDHINSGLVVHVRRQTILVVNLICIVNVKFILYIQPPPNQSGARIFYYT